MPELLLIEGAAGSIELLVEEPSAAAAAPAVRAFGVVCHPHPLYGGALTNKVVHTVARAFLDHGVPTIRFNFRGVGRSEGAHDDGRGETEDTLRVVQYARRRWSGAELWLAGFSFGAFVALRAAGAARPARLVTVAPPVGRWDFSRLVAPECPWLIVQGDRDELVSHERVAAWAAGFAPPPRLVVLAGVDHFFHGRLHQLRNAVGGFLQEP